MNCQEVMELMQRSLDGDLDATETTRMTEHIQGCPECAAMLERLTRLSQGLAQLPRVVPKISIVDSILPQLEQLEIGTGSPAAAPAVRPEAEPSAAPLGPRSSRRRRKTLQRISGAVAASIVALLLVSHPQSWLHAPGVNHDAASDAGPGATDRAAAIGGLQEKNEVRFSEAITEKKASGANGQAGADGQESAQAPKASADQPQEPSLFSQQAEPSPSSAPVHRFEAGAAASPDAAPSPQQSGAGANDPLHVDSSSAASSANGGGSEPDTGRSLTADIASSSERVSPDGKLKATVEGGKLEIVRTADGSTAFESAASDGGSIAILRWEDDSSALHYVRTEADGSQKALVWSAATGQETEDDGT